MGRNSHKEIHVYIEGEQPFAETIARILSILPYMRGFEIVGPFSIRSNAAPTFPYELDSIARVIVSRDDPHSGEEISSEHIHHIPAVVLREEKIRD